MEELLEDKYSKWIVNTINDTYGKCEEYTQKMNDVFPELERVRGHYFCPIWGKREHWWLISSRGKIVDPTKNQFPSKGIGEYVQLDESMPEPTGKCPNCGEYVYENNYFCCDNCEGTYMVYLQNV